MPDPGTKGNQDIMTSLSPIPAKAELKITPNKLVATLTLTPPQNGGPALTLEQLKQTVAQKGVVFGLREDRLNALSSHPTYGEPVVVAEGKNAEDGRDAEIKYYIQLERNLKPKVNSDGSVDFRDLGLIEKVSKGDKLCTKIPPTAGVPGNDVFGAVIAPKPGKEINIPAGKNTVMDEDGLTVLAGITGQAEVINKKVNVLDTYTVEGDVSTSTGDIQFVGNVVIKGGVATGFSVNASGNIDIMGVVESATIMSGGSLIIRGGFNGGEGGKLEVGEHLTCKYIQGGHVTLGGNLETTYILNASVNCGGSVNMSGKGLIMGGHTTARISVNASWLGGANTRSNTIIEVGNDPALLKRSYEIPKEIEVCNKNMARIEAVVKALLQLKAANRLTQDQFENLEKSLRYLSQLKTTSAALQEENESVKEKLAESGHGSVKVQRTAYPGVKIIIGSEQFPLQSEYSFTNFTRTREGITGGPYR